ncbi:MAG: fibronectin type III domain-containing protein [Bacteroidales bacterium]|nr:fibronectin type III domain-containing protein [Bacteroidales bacterium]
MKVTRLSLLFLLLTLSLTSLRAQGVHYSTSFETAADTVGWVFLNGTQTNQWHVGTAADYGISHSLYISSDSGATYAYEGRSASAVYAYYEFTLADPICNIRFDWRCQGITYHDYMRAYVVPATATFTPGQLPSGAANSYDLYDDTVPAGWVQLEPSMLAWQTSWQHVDTMLTLTAGTYRLLFLWCNSGMTEAMNPPIAVDNVVIDEPGCPTPRNLRFSNITNDSCVLSWDNRGAAAVWSLEYDALPLVPGLGLTDYAYDTTITLEYLSPNTTYEVYVRADCATSMSPAIHGIFHTNCNVAQLPIVENFENWTDSVSSCWHRSRSSGNTQYTPNVSANFAHSGSKSIKFTGSNSEYLALPYTYVDDPVQGLTLAFWVYKAATTTSRYWVYIGVMTDPNDVTTFTPVDTVAITDGYQWSAVEVSLASYVGNGRYVALKSPHSSIYIDDITLDRTSGCITPSDLTFSDIAADSCTVSWHERGLATRWTVEYSSTPIVPGTGNANILYVNDTVFRLGGLSPNTTYYVYVQAVCGNNASFYLQGRVRTACQPVQLPYTEDFSSWRVGSLYGIDSVSCWRFGTNDSPSSAFRIIENNSAHSDTHMVAIAAGNGKYSYMTLPVVGVPVRSLTLSLWLKKNYGNDSLLFVGVMDNPYDVSTFTPVDTLTLVEYWQSYSVPLDSYTNQGRCVALMLNSCGVYVDDISLNYSSGCLMPTDLRVSAKTATSLTLSWNSCPNRISSLIEYGPAGFTYGTGTVVATTANTITLTGLTPRAYYDFYLRDICGLDTSFVAILVSVQFGVWTTRANATDTIQFCGGVLCDDGGLNDYYSNNQRSTVVLMPMHRGSEVYLNGTFWCGRNDTVYIYDGIGTGGTLLGAFSWDGYGVSLINVNTVRSSDTSGALTVFFVSDYISSGRGYELNVLCGSPTSCDPPSPLSVSGITNTSATVSWGDAGLYQVACKSAASSVWPAGDFVNDSCYTYTGLINSTLYDWRVRRICDGVGYSDTSEWAYSTFHTINPAPCNPPYDLAVRDTTSSTATVTWGGEGTYQVDCRKTGTTEWNTYAEVTANEYTLRSLRPATPYQWRVRHNCSESLHSPWLGGTFTTKPANGITDAADLGGVSIAVYPNPAAPGSDVEVSVKGAAGPVTLTLYDAAGRALQSVAQTIPTAPSACFHLQAPSRGTYFLKLRTPTSTTTHKLVIR